MEKQVRPSAPLAAQPYFQPQTTSSPFSRRLQNAEQTIGNYAKFNRADSGAKPTLKALFMYTCAVATSEEHIPAQKMPVTALKKVFLGKHLKAMTLNGVESTEQQKLGFLLNTLEAVFAQNQSQTDEDKLILNTISRVRQELSIGYETIQARYYPPAKNPELTKSLSNAANAFEIALDDNVTFNNRADTGAEPFIKALFFVVSAVTAAKALGLNPETAAFNTYSNLEKQINALTLNDNKGANPNEKLKYIITLVKSLIEDPSRRDLTQEDDQMLFALNLLSKGPTNNAGALRNTANRSEGNCLARLLKCLCCLACAGGCIYTTVMATLYAFLLFIAFQLINNR